MAASPAAASKAREGPPKSDTIRYFPVPTLSASTPTSIDVLNKTAIRLTGNPRVVADLTDRHVRGELDLHPVSGELLMVERVPLSTEENEIQVVLHWFTELEAQLRAAGR